MIFFLLRITVSLIGNELQNIDMVTREKITAIKYYEHRLNEKPLLIPARFGTEYPDWMKDVNGELKLLAISIPGTHETCALYGGAYVQCQDIPLANQLLLGVRYFDIRCRHINDAFMIHHGFVYQYQAFGNDVRDVFIKFLKEHPTETILMMVKEEYDASNNTRGFDDTMQSYIDEYPEYFYLEPINPTLDQVRGKIVLFRRFSTWREHFGNELQFKDNAIFFSYTTIDARVQDCYKIATIFERATKWSQMQQVLQEAKKDQYHQNLYINYGSGTGVLCFPYAVSEYINPLLGDHIVANPNDFLGVLMIDFIELYYDNVIAQIINRNYVN